MYGVRWNFRAINWCHPIGRHLLKGQGQTLLKRQGQIHPTGRSTRVQDGTDTNRTLKCSAATDRVRHTYGQSGRSARERSCSFGTRRNWPESCPYRSSHPQIFKVWQIFKTTTPSKYRLKHRQRESWLASVFVAVIGNSFMI